MSAAGERGLDLLAALAAAVAVVMAAVYVGVMLQQGDRPLLWVVALLASGAGLAAYGAGRTHRRRRAALLVSGALLTGLGVLAILSIGFPIVLAGALCLVAAARASDPEPAQRVSG
jgi:hypothetical protein